MAGVERNLRDGSNIRLRNVLVPIDFSDDSTRSTRYAATIAEKFGSRLVLVNVIETVAPAYDLGYMSGPALNWDKQVARIRSEKLAQFADDHIDRPISCNCVIRSGEATEQILSAALENQCDLIVMGTHGRTGAKHMVLGSVAEKTIRCSTCPVLVMRSGQPEFLGKTANQQLDLREIVAPTDFSTGSEEALKWAEMLARETHARLNLLYVVSYHYIVGEYDALEYPGLEAEMMESGRRRMSEKLKREEALGIQVESSVVHGAPRQEILKFAEQQKAQIIVMGTRGLTGIKHLLLGSTAEYVVRHAPCAVMVVPTSKATRKPRSIANQGLETIER